MCVCLFVRSFVRLLARPLACYFAAGFPGYSVLARLKPPAASDLLSVALTFSQSYYHTRDYYTQINHQSCRSTNSLTNVHFIHLNNTAQTYIPKIPNSRATGCPREQASPRRMSACCQQLSQPANNNKYYRNTRLQ